jgi:UDP-4-keto-D-FucNAc 4-reductase
MAWMMISPSGHRPQSILITGANGFLGAEIVNRALAAGFHVQATDRGHTCFMPGVTYIQADILNPETLVPAIRGADTVIHAAGLAHIFGQGKEGVSAFRDINEVGTRNVVKAAAQAHVRHFILISSVSVYGKGPRVGEYEENANCHPEGPYAESKYLAEQRALEMAGETHLDLTVLRLGTAYGGGDPGNINRLMRAIDRRRFLGIAPGLNRKSLIHRKDVGRACLSVLQDPPNGVHIYNVAGRAHTIKEIVEELAAALGQPIPRGYVPSALALYSARVGKSLSFGKGRLSDLCSIIEKWLSEDVFDSTKFETTFHFAPQVSLREGIKEEVAWYRSRPEEKAKIP